MVKFTSNSPIDLFNGDEEKIRTFWEDLQFEKSQCRRICFRHALCRKNLCCSQHPLDEYTTYMRRKIAQFAKCSWPMTQVPNCPWCAWGNGMAAEFASEELRATWLHKDHKAWDKISRFQFQYSFTQICSQFPMSQRHFSVVFTLWLGVLRRMMRLWQLRSVGCQVLPESCELGVSQHSGTYATLLVAYQNSSIWRENLEGSESWDICQLSVKYMENILQADLPWEQDWRAVNFAPPSLQSNLQSKQT